MIYDPADSKVQVECCFASSMKVASHGAYRAKRKPNSPRVQAYRACKGCFTVWQERREFKRDMYGIEVE